jgi:ketosteroid isomerase-like protein
MPQTPHSDPDRASLEMVLQELYGARAVGDLERLCALFAPEAVFRISGSSDGKPIAIAAKGLEEIRSWLEVLVKTFRLSRYEIESMLIERSKAAVHWRAGIHSRVTGANTATELIDLIEIGNGRIRSFTELFVPTE